MSVEIKKDITTVQVEVPKTNVAVENAVTQITVQTSQPSLTISQAGVSGKDGTSGTSGISVLVDTGSFATTGSNQFSGSQYISGSIVFENGSYIEAPLGANGDIRLFSSQSKGALYVNDAGVTMFYFEPGGGSSIGLQSNSGITFDGNIVSDINIISNQRITGSLFLSGSESTIVLPNHSSAPTSPNSGALYFNTTDFHFYGWDGGQWKQLDN